MTEASNSNCKPKLTPDEQLEMCKEKLAAAIDNHFFRENKARVLPSFDASELGIGPRLGVGGFCNVGEVSGLKLNADFDPPPQDAATVHLDTAANEVNGAVNGAAEEHKAAGAMPRSRHTEANGGASETKELGDASAAADLAPSTAAADTDANAISEAFAEDQMHTDLGLGRNSADADHHENHYDLSPRTARYFMAEQCLREGIIRNSKDARYAVKKLRHDLSEEEKVRGILDLAIEAKFLAVISHPNIIKMRGTAASDPLGKDYFILMDRLYGTLEDKIYDWSELHRKYGGCCGIFGKGNIEMNHLMLDRLTAAYDIATVFRHLHDQNIIYRDIKAENIGFDVRGDVKVFDFGLAKVLKREDRLKDGLYKLTGLTGSLRYMAPEVVRCEPYNLMADVFSFGILLWQILALRVPFENFTMGEHEALVCDKGFRPSVSRAWPVFSREVMKDCWAENIKDRPDFIRISNTIRVEMEGIADADHESIHNRTDHMMNKSQRSHRNLRRALPAETTDASANSEN